MNDTAPLRRIWLCADDYGIAEGVNRAIRDLIASRRLNATSVRPIDGPTTITEVALRQPREIKSRMARLTPSASP